VYDNGLVNVAHTLEAHAAASINVNSARAGGMRADRCKSGGRRHRDSGRCGESVIFLDLNLIADVPYAKEPLTALIPLKIQWGGLATTTIAW